VDVLTRRGKHLRQRGRGLENRQQQQQLVAEEREAGVQRPEELGRMAEQPQERVEEEEAARRQQGEAQVQAQVLVRQLELELGEGQAQERGLGAEPELAGAQE
ncbi:hypothetical protein EV177_009955, partial [Coemansia sp. RSA 1804]